MLLTCFCFLSLRGFFFCYPANNWASEDDVQFGADVTGQTAGSVKQGLVVIVIMVNVITSSAEQRLAHRDRHRNVV